MVEDNKAKSEWKTPAIVIALISAIIAALGLYVTIDSTYWIKKNPGQPIRNAPILAQVGTYIYQAIVSQPQSPNPASAPASTAAPAVTPTPPTLSWTPLHRLSTNGDITFEVGGKIKIDPSNASYVHVPFRIASQGTAHKIFALNAFPLAGWSLSTVSGINCHIDTNLHGLHVYTRNEFNDYVNEIQVAVPGAQVTGNISASCDKHINNNDMFYLATQLYVLPEEATPGNATPSVINFNSEPITAN